ncbi:MAG TPA: exodeoxyribonuclease VII small subunit [Candidatus Eisenbacteria bacterium]|nr:exodeoxyribonuclease VII small subunit [Candidatus Eisenbacteria bacterium]
MKRKEGPAATGTRAGEESPPFEAMMQKLQDIVGTLERGNLSLEDSIRSFEEGVDLVKRCTEVLDQAERRIQKLTRDAEGRPAVVPVEEDRDADDERSDELPF